MTSVDGSIPINREVYAGKTYYEGTILKVSGTVLAPTTASGNTPVAVCDDATVDDEGTARAARSGENLAVHLLGSGHIVRVKSTVVTYSLGEAVFVGNTEGQAFDNGAAANLSGRVGTCAEPAGVAVATAGDLITVILDNFAGQLKGGTV